jgi:hypothetical protein
LNGWALSCALIIGVTAPVAAGQPAADAPRKQAHATRIGEGVVRLDGRLDEAFWETAIPVTDFVQQEPTENAPPIDRIDVRFVYDDSALWVGARLDSIVAPGVQAPMSRRDDGDQSESLVIELDTFLDRRTAYAFGVTASGVRLDHFHPTDNQDDEDEEFAPVWRARTHIDERGWSAELWIPFSQLRFTDQPERVWGLNIRRYRPTINEQDYWALIGRTGTGWASRFGDLRGIVGVDPKARLELLPYLAGGSRVSGNRNPDNPFDDGKNLSGRVGADIKVGIGPNLTLDATINPDFGQVEADPAQINLSVFEVIFDERRPFFIEGNNVLAAGTSNYYYSRRIGARPTDFVSTPAAPAVRPQFVDFPGTTEILGAAKLTGRVSTNTSVGFLAAVTDSEHAGVSTGGVRSEIKVAPRSEWLVGRIIQQFGSQSSTVGAHVTMVHRELDPNEFLASRLNRNAITVGADTRVRFANRTYEAAGNVGLTFLTGEPAQIARVQQAAGHYLQRVDQPNIRFDPTRRSLEGAQIQGSINKIGGRHWLWGGNVMIESPEFDPLDFGRLNYAGDVTGGPRLNYRETRPGRIFRAYSLQVALNTYFYFDFNLGVRKTINTTNSFTFRNFWVATLNSNHYLRGNDTQQTRGGPAMGTPRGMNVTSTLRNNTAATTYWTASQIVRRNELGDRSYETSGSLSARPSPSLQLSVTPTYLNEKGTGGIFSGPLSRQYLATIDGGSAATYGKRYVFGLVDRTTFSSQFRVNYTFKPDMTLDVYAEPFAASGQYRGYGELARPRDRDLRLYGTDGTTITRQADLSFLITDGAQSFRLANQDFNNRSFRSNVVFRWEWRPGSIFFAVWQQNRASAEPDGRHVGVGDLFNSLSAPGDNIFAIKTTIWRSR